jgi:putative transposase
MSFVDHVRDAHDFPAGLVLRVLGIAPSTYYDWRARRAAPSQRQLDDAAVLEQIVKIRSVTEFAAAYGSPRVWLELRRQGVHVGRKRVERIMREHGLQGAHLRRGWKTGSTRQNPAHRPAPDLLERDFTATPPNRVWVADLTRIVTGEGVLWLASVRDAFSNRVTRRCGSPNAWSTLVSSRRPGPQGTAMTMPSPRTCGPRSRSSCCTGPAPRSRLAAGPSTP